MNAQPCPFCGSTDVVVQAIRSETHDGVAVYCNDCGSQGPVETSAQAIAAWNRVREAGEEPEESDDVTVDLDSDLPLQWEYDGDDDSAYAAFGQYSDSVSVSPLPATPDKYSVDVQPPHVDDLETGKHLAEAIAEAVRDFFNSPSYLAHRSMRACAAVKVSPAEG